MPEYRISIVVDGKDNASAPLGRVGGALGNMAQIAGGIIGANMIGKVVDGIMGIGRAALDSYANYERLGMSLTSLVAKEMVSTGQADSLTAAMDSAGASARGLQDWITKLAIQSPFTQDGVASAFRMAMAYGFTTDESKRLTQAMIDFSSATGADESAMTRIALALGQIKAKGRLAGQEMLQLTEAGLNVRDILAKAMGITTQEVIKLQEKGLMPANVAIEAITASLETDYAGAAKKSAGTFSGLLSSLSDIKTVGLREFFEGTFKSVQPYVQSFVDMLSSEKFMNALNKTGQGFGDMIGKAVKFFDPAIKFMRGFFSGITSGKTTLNALREGIRGAFGKEALQTFNKFAKVISGIGTFFSPLSKFIKSFTNGLESGKTPLNALREGIRSAFGKEGLVAFNNFITGLSGAIATASTWINTSLIPAISSLAAWFMVNLLPALSTLWTWLKVNIPDAIATSSAFFTANILPALSALWTFISTWIIPALGALVMWFVTNIPVALTVLKGFWENTLLPALATVYNFFTANILPTLSLVAAWLATNIPVAISTLTTWWNGTLMPALNNLWTFIQTSILPVFESFKTVVVNLLEYGFMVLSAFWENILLPNLQALWDKAEPVRKVLADMGAYIGDALVKAFEGVNSAIEKFVSWLTEATGGLSGVEGWLSSVKGWFDELAISIGKLKLPKWLEPGSPTPLEMGLRGINDAMRGLSGHTLPGFENGMALSGVGAGMGQMAPAPINITFTGPIGNDIDVETLAYRVAQVVRERRS